MLDEERVLSHARRNRRAGCEPLGVRPVVLGAVTDQSGQLIRARARTGNEGVVDRRGDVRKSDAARQRWIQSSRTGMFAVEKKTSAPLVPCGLTAAFGGQDVGVGQPRLVTRDRDVHIVFERELDGVLQRDFKLAFVNQLLDARFVRSVELRNLDTAIRREQIRKRLWRVLVVIFSRRPTTRESADSSGPVRKPAAGCCVGAFGS